MNAPAPLVSVCVCTFRRPALLAELLRSLAAQRAGPFRFEVIVVDNDAAASGRAAVDAARGPWDRLAYAVEPRQGISYARNRAVGLARGEFVAFIDDDEVASAGWLDGLVSTQARHDCDVVLGPVLPMFPPGSPRWGAASRFFDRPRHATGAPVPVTEGRTGNALARSRWLAGGEPFEPRYALTGGEDYAFFRRIADAGATLRWCDEASVTEIVPLERQRLRWVLERALRGSVTYSRLNGAADAWPLRMTRAALGVGVGVACSLLGFVALPLGVHHSVRLWARAAKGYGRVLALTSRQIESYRHG